MENWIELMDCNKNDVLSFPELFKVGKVREVVNQASQNNEVAEALIYLASSEGVSINNISNLRPPCKLLDKGVDCEILRIGSNGWQKGRVRLKLQVTVEFCPDEPEVEETQMQNELEISQSESPLDDLRKMINQENKQ